MSLNRIDLSTVLAEISPVLTDGWIQKIHQPHDFSLTFDVRSQGASVLVYICTEPKLTRLHFVSKKYSNPSTPPPFCQFLRSHLEGGRIQEITQQPEDRLLYMTVRKDETSYKLAIALWGNRANVLLLNKDDRLLRSLKESRVQIGERFIQPPLRPSAPTQVASPWKAAIREKPTQGEERFASLYPLSAALEIFYEKREQENNQHTLHDQQLTHARKALKAAKGKLHGLREDLKKAERYREYGRYGELMKSSLHEMHRGQETATLTDYFDPALPTLTLPLDPAKDPVRNMEEYFRKHHKYLGAQEHLLPRIETQEQKVAKLEEHLTQIEQGNMDSTSLSTPTKKHQPLPTPRSTKIKPAPAQGYRTYTSIDGLEIFVGKSAKDNDHLTFKISKPDDLWLHARGTPGSHVIVRLEKGQTIPHETLKDAATLTLWFSDLRKSGKGEVIYTLRKFVKKAKGQKPGAVHVTRDKALWIECKEERLERLKAPPS